MIVNIVKSGNFNLNVNMCGKRTFLQIIPVTKKVAYAIKLTFRLESITKI